MKVNSLSEIVSWVDISLSRATRENCIPPLNVDYRDCRLPIYRLKANDFDMFKFQTNKHCKYRICVQMLKNYHGVSNMVLKCANGYKDLRLSKPRYRKRTLSELTKY